MTQEFKKFDPRDYQSEKDKQQLPKRNLQVPKGIDDVLADVDQTIKGNLSNEYRQEGGQ